MPDTVRQVPMCNDRHRYEPPAGGGGGGGSGYSSPAVSPSHSFKRSRSTVYLVDRRTSPPPGRLLQPHNVTANWHAALFWTLISSCTALPWMANALLVRAPAACLCLWARVAWACVRVPLVASRRVLRALFGRRHRRPAPPQPQYHQPHHHQHHRSGATAAGRQPRTVLIGGGSTVQALHLARNYYAAGDRVVVCEVEGRAELCSFSIAVDAHYTVPGPAEDSCVQYVDALCAIVDKERVGLYVPTGTTVAPYHDAVAKSHLELLGCRCHAPGLDAVAALDDLAEVFQRCEAVGLPVPKHLLVQSKEDIVKLYDNVSFRADRHFIVNVGAAGCKARHGRLRLPANRKSLTLPGPVSPDCPWLLVQTCLGSYYTTCTTVHRGRVVGNVTCTADADSVGASRGHGPLMRDGGGTRCSARNQLLDDWVAHFVSAVPPFDGTVEFTLCVTPSRTVVPVGCRVGVPVTYASYRSNFERVLYPPEPCVADAEEPEVLEITDRYYATALAFDTARRLAAADAICATVKRLLRVVATRREMVFARRDPLPYFVYYNLQLIMEYVHDALQGGGYRAALSGGHRNRHTTF